MTRKKALIHIGGHKTGSTAIQQSLFDSSSALEAQGICYPLELTCREALFWGQHSLVWQLIDLQVGENFILSQHQINQSITTLKRLKDQHTNIVLSSENFIQLDDEKISHLTELLSDFDIYVVIYVRRQDEALLALYQTDIVFYQEAKTFEHWLTSKSSWFDYFSIIKRWEAITNGTVIVRPYDRSKWDGSDIVCDFTAILSKIFEQNVPLSTSEQNLVNNKSLPASITNIVRYYNAQPNSKKITPRLLSLGYELNSLNISSQYEPISPSMKKTILEKFHEGNLELSKQYLGLNEVWFNDVVNDDNVEWQNNNSFNGRELWALVNEIMEAIAMLKAKSASNVEMISSASNNAIAYKGLHDKAEKLSVEEWIALVGKSIEQVATLEGIAMPSAPPNEKQAIFNGRGGSDVIKAAAPVYRYALKVCQQQGIAPIKTLLDFGCGWGRFTRLFVRDVQEAGLFGVDPWDEALQMCRQHMPYAAFVRSQPIPPLAFRDDFFDVVFANSIFSHLSESSALSWIEEIMRVLRPGGVLIATTHAKHFLVTVKEYQSGERPCETAWHRSFKNATIDFTKAIDAHQQGEFIYVPDSVATNSGYGDSFVPESYIQKVWGKFLEPIQFIDDPARFPQATFTLRKPMTTR